MSLISSIILFATTVVEASADKDDHFDYFIFAQVYPTAICQVDNDFTPDSCEIPNGTTHWTIHGLWPTRQDGSYPQFCRRREGKFHPSELSPIEDILTSEWPNLFPHKSRSSLWKHEWDKHGTCAASLPATQGEKNFFSKSLELHRKYSVADALQQSGIVPTNENTYQLKHIDKAVESALTNGRTIKVHCLKDAKTGEYFLADIRICIDKDFRPIDCRGKGNRYPRTAKPTYQPCPSEGIRYIPAASGVIAAKELSGLDSRRVPTSGAGGAKWGVYGALSSLAHLLKPLKFLSIYLASRLVF
uniref:Ribonuclease Oy n=1 Tax=Ascaris suum TaxID=6253 RepID=F1L443_ASCSU